MALARQLTVRPPATDQLALLNCGIVHPSTFDSSVRYAWIKETFPVRIVHDPSIEKDAIAFSAIQRQWMQLSQGASVHVNPFDPAKPAKTWLVPSLSQSLNSLPLLARVTFDIDVNARSARTPPPVDCKLLAEDIHRMFPNMVFSVQQLLLVDYMGHYLRLTVREIETFNMQELSQGRFIPNDLDSLDRNASQQISPKDPMQMTGLLLPETSFSFIKSLDTSPIVLTNTDRQASSSRKKLIQPNFQFEDLGIGGLDKEFNTIFRRAFASRIFPTELVHKLGVKHVRGVLLYGPPGTGKTLMARKIGDLLNARPPKIVSGPEILNKYVGESEKNMRMLFADAESDAKSKGDDSDLHIIIFDEIDAICRQRGARASDTGVGDQVVNQLLSKLDGVEQLNNILVIGMTNRLDLIDKALLRPGRLEIQIEIGLPDEHGRLDILKIHTKSMRDNGLLGTDVLLDEFAHVTKNYSGAELEGLVKNAASFAFHRHVKAGTLAAVRHDDLASLRVVNEDFSQALNEMKPAFGVSDLEIEGCMPYGIHPYRMEIEHILATGSMLIEQLNHSERTDVLSCLLYGEAGTGVTALAAAIAKTSQFPFIKVMSPDMLMAENDQQKCLSLVKLFQDAYKSPKSVILLDDVERLMDYVGIGPRFSNDVLQTLLILLKKSPPKGRKLLILVTSHVQQVLSAMGYEDVLTVSMEVPTVDGWRYLPAIFSNLNVFDEKDILALSKAIEEQVATGDVALNIGLKKLLLLAERARQDSEAPVATFMDFLLQELHAKA